MWELTEAGAVTWRCPQNPHPSETEPAGLTSLAPGTSKPWEHDGANRTGQNPPLPAHSSTSGLLGAGGAAKPPGSLTEPPGPRPPLPAAFVAASGLAALRQHKAEPRGISAAIFSAPLLTNKLLRAGDGEASAAAGPPPRAPPSRRASWPGPRYGAAGNALPSPASRIASASSPLRVVRIQRCHS